LPPEDSEAFADSVLWMRDLRAELRAMGQRSRWLAESEFSRDRLGYLFVKTLEASASR
jgi:hypothetical protein